MNDAAAPLHNALDQWVHDKLSAKLVAEGHTQAEVDTVLATVTSSHPIIDLLMQYGLPLLLQLLSNLLALNKPIVPTPAPPVVA